MSNERLRESVARAGLTLEELAHRVGVDPKTVERWITHERLPHRRHRWTVANLLTEDETYLWPVTRHDSRSNAADRAEFVTLFPDRGAIPSQLWAALIERSSEQLDILVFAGLFLFDTNPRLAEQLRDKASSGVACRLLFGDPDSQAVRQRGDEEGIADALAARIRASIRYLGDASRTPGIEVRLHKTILYNSIYRFDDDLLVNAHVHGAPASLNPVMHLRRVPGAHLFEHYMASFDRVWTSGTPLVTP